MEPAIPLFGRQSFDRERNPLLKSGLPRRVKRLVNHMTNYIATRSIMVFSGVRHEDVILSCASSYEIQEIPLDILQRGTPLAVTNISWSSGPIELENSVSVVC